MNLEKIKAIIVNSVWGKDIRNANVWGETIMLALQEFQCQLDRRFVKKEERHYHTHESGPEQRQTSLNLDAGLESLSDSPSSVPQPIRKPEDFAKETFGPFPDKSICQPATTPLLLCDHAKDCMRYTNCRHANPHVSGSGCERPYFCGYAPVNEVTMCQPVVEPKADEIKAGDIRKVQPKCECVDDSWITDLMDCMDHPYPKFCCYCGLPLAGKEKTR
jgi:hypothetical protein